MIVLRFRARCVPLIIAVPKSKAHTEASNEPPFGLSDGSQLLILTNF
jgi:hypothetical protein